MQAGLKLCSCHRKCREAVETSARAAYYSFIMGHAIIVGHAIICHAVFSRFSSYRLKH